MVKLMMIGIEADSALGNDTVIIIKSWAHSYLWLVPAFLINVFEKTKAKCPKAEKNNFAQAKPKGTKFSHYCSVIDLTPLFTVCLRFRSYLYFPLPPQFWNPIESSERVMHTLHTTASSCLFIRILLQLDLVVFQLISNMSLLVKLKNVFAQ